MFELEFYACHGEKHIKVISIVILISEEMKNSDHQTHQLIDFLLLLKSIKDFLDICSLHKNLPKLLIWYVCHKLLILKILQIWYMMKMQSEIL